MNKNAFDVIVIGAGFGGMCAAARLAHKGYKTLVIERLSFLGGRCSSIERDGFHRSTGAVAITGGSIIEETFKEVGAEFNVRRFQPEAVFRIEGKDYEWPMQQGLANAIYEYSRDKEGAQKVIEAVGRAVMWHSPFGTNTSLKEWLSQFTSDENIFMVFQPFCISMVGVNIHELPVSEFFAWVSKNLGSTQETYNYAPHGNAMLWESLAGVIEQKGGEIWKNAEAKKIIVENHEVRKVLVENKNGNREITAKVVVSNIGPKKTVEITGKEHFDRSYLVELNHIRPTPLLTIATIVSDEPLMEHPGLVWPIGSSRLVCLIAPTVCCPELAPPGKHILESYSGIFEPRSSVDPKHELDMNLEELYRLIPKARKEGKLLTAGCWQRDWPLFHSDWREFPQKTPVINLYNVGDGARISGLIGIKLCAETARIVVDDIAGRIPPG